MIDSARRIIAVCVVAICLVCAESASAFQTTPYPPLATGLLAQAGTQYVDGISDQSMPTWDGNFAGAYFKGFFSSIWTPHIRYARYVVQWNVMAESSGGPNPNGDYRERFEAWYTDALSLGLTLDVSLINYTGSPPASSTYQEKLEVLLNTFPNIRDLEAWDEPNNTAGLTASGAAHYTNYAYSDCERHGCTLVAGNFLDSSSNLVSYEKEYEAQLNPSNPPNWGIHPYLAVKNQSETTVQNFKANLPNGGAGDQIWFTEVGAYQCEDYHGLENRGERQQAADASWLANRLMPAFNPTHVFYYEFLYKNREQPPCNAETGDTALYVPSADPNAPDAPRPAAAFILSGNGKPWGYTGGASAANAEQATLTGSVYPGGFLDAKYYFEYGPSPSYGSQTAHGDAGAGLGGVGASLPVGGLAEGTTYHYRIVAVNSEGSTVGSDGVFITPRRPTVTTGAASNVQEEQATLNGTVNGNGLNTQARFEYGETSAYGSSTPWVEVGSMASNASSTVGGLKPGITYHYRVVATSSAGTSYGSDQVLTALEVQTSSRWAVRNPVTGEQWVYYLGSTGSIDQWGWNTKEWGWAEHAGHAAAAGTSPTVVRDLGTGEQWVYYQGSNGSIDWWGWNTKEWGWAEHAGHAAATGTSPTVVRNPVTTEQWVYYQGSNGNIDLWTWSGKEWVWAERAGHAAAAGTSPTVVRNPVTGEQWVYYQGSNGSIDLWNWNGKEWGWAERAGHAAAAGSSPTVTRDPSTGEQWVSYQGSNGSVDWWGWNTKEWGWAEHPGHAAAAGTSPTVVRNPVTGEQWVSYQGSNGSIDWWGWNTKEWGWAEHAGHAAATGMSPTVVRDSSTGEQWVYYPGSSGSINLWGWNTKEWGWAEL
jgi:hypothetical protein